MKRQSKSARRTAETDVEIELNLDGAGSAEIRTGLGFFDHMLNLLARHSLFDLRIEARGDLQVDGHHLVEDVGITLGRCINEALADSQGLSRYGWAAVPMDEALALAAVDLGGRSHLGYDVPLGPGRCGEFEPELAREFFRALAANAPLNLHLRLLAGGNTHHCLEACFKAVARALRAAVALDPREIGRASCWARV